MTAVAPIRPDQRHQYLPQMTEKDYERLKDSIRRSGGLWPGHEIEVDEDGVILDGHHRAKACAELGVDCPARVRTDLTTEDEKFAYIWSINMARRHLSIEQKREMVRLYLTRFPDRSNRQVAETAGLDHKTVGVVRQGMEASGEIPQTVRPHQRKDQRSAPSVTDDLVEVRTRSTVGYYDRDGNLVDREPTYEPDHLGHPIMKFVLVYTVPPKQNPNPTERDRAGLPHAREETKWWKGECVMNQPIPTDMIGLGVFAREVGMQFERAVRANPFVTMLTDS
jgi:hypothetical protein